MNFHGPVHLAAYALVTAAPMALPDRANGSNVSPCTSVVIKTARNTMLKNCRLPPTWAITGKVASQIGIAPRSYRRWGTGMVAISALGGIAYLADFAIGANIGISYGTTNALWGIGVCYMWPTMLATASERFPRGGALLMGLMGTAGTLSIQFVLPLMGAVYDKEKVAAAGGAAAFEALQPGPELERVLGLAAQASFRYVAVLPAILLVVFGAIWLYDRSRGGFRPEQLRRS